MKLEKEDFDWAVQQGLISSGQAESLWNAFIHKHSEDEEINNRPRFNFANVAYYFGALIVISAMGWFMTLAWESFGGAGIFFIALIYAICFIFLGRRFYFRQNFKVPGGLLFTMAVCMTPLAIYGLQRWSGFWIQGDPGTYRDFHIWVKGSWFLMEVGTIWAALIALKFVKFPFLTAPIAFSLWYMSMDLTPLIFGKNDYTWQQRAWVSLWFGIACIVVAYLIDLRTRRSRGDFAFWIYLFGLICFWFSLPFTGKDTEWSWFIYCLINLGLVFLSILLKRRLFIIFGGLGIFTYLSHLATIVFADSMLFPFALSLIGIAIIYSGILYQRHYQSLERYFERVLPLGVRNLLPRER